MSKSNTNLLAIAGQSQLLVIDLQDKLNSVMAIDAMQLTLKNTGILLQAANFLEVPILLTEQYPQGLGDTVPEIRQHLSNAIVIAKTAFSATKEPKVQMRLHRDRPQIVLAGMEAHICVLQTALDLTAQGKQVFVVEDAVISRNNTHKHNAIARLLQAGCVITNTESLVFEWLGDANHAAFKTIAKLIK